MSRCLVIGGTLFIGRALVSRLLERGDDVTILHRGRGHPFGDRVRELRCDRNDAQAVARTIRAGRYDYAFDNVYDWQRGTAAAHVLAAAEACGPELRRYVFLSSCAAYGGGLDRDEDSELAGPDHPEEYCRNKAGSERALLALRAGGQAVAATLRPPFVYGPGNPFYREAFFWDRLVRGRPIIVPGDGSRLMQFVHAADVAEAALRAAESPAAAGRAYNVANAKPIRQDDLVRTLAEAAGVEPVLRYVPRDRIRRLGGQVFAEPYYFAQYFDLPAITTVTDRAREELGFEPTPFADGLRGTFEAYERARPDSLPAPDFSFDDELLAAA